MKRSSEQPSKKPDGRITVQAIADFAGVSIGSVSTVLNNRHIERRITQRTVEKIRSAAMQLGYMPNISARRLRGSHTVKNSVLLALVTSAEAPLALMNHFISAMREPAEAERGFTMGVDFSLMIEIFSAGHLRDMPGLLSGDVFNAAIITNTAPQDDDFLQRSHLPYPNILVNRSIPGFSCVLENPSIGAMAADVLYKTGRTRFGIIYSSLLTQATSARVNSFLQRASELVGRAPAEIVSSALSEAAASQAMSDFLKKHPRVDALYATTDGLALGAYHAVKQAGLRIPEDIAVIGVGDHDNSPFFDPPLSSIGVAHSTIGRASGQLLLKQLGRGRFVPEKVEIPAQTALRASTGH